MSIKALFAFASLWTVWEYTTPNHDHQNYVKKYSGLAIQEMERTGIPASIKLAQAILESDAGRSTLATKARNHFGIKCGNRWNGSNYYKKDDDYVNGRLVKSCFRSYDKVYHSYMDHSDFLANGKRYQFLFELDKTNYKAWARGLKKAGYATSPYYHKRLIDLIERYKLYEYDHYPQHHTKQEERELIAEAEQRFLTRNDVDYILAREGQTVDDIARKAKVPASRLLRYNEELYSSDQSLPNGEIVFLQSKRKSWRGKATWHVVKAGESMYDIAQRYGLRLDKLYQRNQLTTNAQPAAGQRIKIRGSEVEKPPRIRAVTLPPALEKPEVGEDDEFLWEEEEPGGPLPETVSPPMAELPPLTNADPSTGSPSPGTAAVQPSGPKHHVVQSGETLWRISQTHGVPVDELKRHNNLRSNTIHRGMQLRIP